MSEVAPTPRATLADLTTLRLGGPAARLVVATDEAELVEAVSAADADGTPLLVLGGGSNLVVADAGFDGTVVRVATSGMSTDLDDDAVPGAASCGGVLVTVAAGVSWDEVVAHAVEHGWSGIEALSGIPGAVGATPVQNVGAYGQDVAQTLARVRVWDRRERRVRTLAASECGFGYRTSRFKADPAGFVVLDVTFQLASGTLGPPVAYAELASALGTEVGRRAPLGEVRAAVLGLRAAKGMVLDDADHDTWSAGSFFTNPVVQADRVPEGAPSWPNADGSAKTSAAWLIERAGFRRGHLGPGGRVGLSTKHTLALTNRGGGTATELVALAREVRDGVRDAFDITLTNEPVLVGCVL